MALFQFKCLLRAMVVSELQTKPSFIALHCQRISELIGSDIFEWILSGQVQCFCLKSIVLFFNGAANYIVWITNLFRNYKQWLTSRRVREQCINNNSIVPCSFVTMYTVLLLQHNEGNSILSFMYFIASAADMFDVKK